MNIKPFSKSVDASIIAAYKKGATLAVLAKKHKCSTAKIRRLLRSKKVTLRCRGPKAKAKKVKAKKVKTKKAKTKKAKTKKAKSRS